MAYFHLRLAPPRTTFPADATPEEGVAMAAHAAYWHKQASAGTAVVVGPVFAEGGSFGVAIVEVDGPAQAQALADGDPVIGAGLGFSYTVSPMPSIILRQASAGNQAK